MVEEEALRARLLGPVNAWDGQRQIDLGPPRQRALFATLAAHANQVVSREQLIDDIWGTDAPTTAVNSIYTYVAGLRGRLEPDRPHRGSSKVLVSDGSGYLLNIDSLNVDANRFGVHLARARALASEGAPHRAIGELDAALGLWSGPAYGGVLGPFAEGERLRLGELRLSAIEDRAELLLTIEPQAELIGELLGLVRRHPLRERLRYLLMRCYAGLGRQTDALAQYHDLRARLNDELGVEPGDALHQFYVQLLRRSQADCPTAKPARPFVRAQLARDIPDFTGREAERRRLRDLLTECAEEGPVVLLTGGPGVGKTATAIHVAHELADRYPDGQLQINLRGFSDRNKPMDSSEALGNLLGALGEWSPPPADHERQCALYRGVLAGRRMLILLDNAASVEQVRPLLPGTSSCAVLVTSRNRLTGLSVREGARSVPLDGMADEEAVQLFLRALGRPVDASQHAAVRRLVAACGRLPLALRVAATRIQAAPLPEQAIADFTEDDLMLRLDVPGDAESSVRRVFEWSIRALPDEAAAMFQALGRQSGPTVALAAAANHAGISPSCARHLFDALIEANLLHETSRDEFGCNPLVFAYARHLASKARAS